MQEVLDVEHATRHRVVLRHVGARRMFQQELVQVAFGHELEQHRHGLLAEADAEQAHDVRVLQVGHQVRLALEVAFGLVGGVFLKRFDRDWQHGALRHDQLAAVDFAERAFAELFDEAN